MKARVLFASLGVCLVVAAAQAETLVYEHEGSPLFSIEVPDGWLIDLDFAEEAREAGTYEEGEELKIRVVEIQPDDGRKIWLGIWAVPDADTIPQAADYLLSLRRDLFTGLEVLAAAEADLGGMRGMKMQGTGKREGESVELAMALFEARAGVIVAALYVGVPDAWSVHREELDTMVASVRPAS